MEDSIEVVQTDGLTGLDGKGVTDIAICGMGGELISKILDAATFVKDEGIRLILQPMTKSEDLYRYLCKNGFSIVGEALVREDRIYRVICAEYTGNVSTPDDVHCLLGEKNIENGADLLPEYAARRIAEFTKKRNGMKSADLDTSYEDKIISELELYAKAQNN
jgi:tRNA (adenine22-N1)-methyltransferase